MTKRTKIVCTIGPASSRLAALVKMIKLGMNVARLNFSHGSHGSHAKLIKNVRAAAKKAGQPVAILQDLQGPRIRVGDLPQEGVTAPKGARIALVTEKIFASGQEVRGYKKVPIQYARLYRDVKKGDRILIEDGTIGLRVEKSADSVIRCMVTAGGVIKSHKGINVPGVRLRVNVITEKDKTDLAFGIKQSVDFVAMSFVRGPEDIVRMKKIIERMAGRRSGRPQVIAKIEREEAVNNFEKILARVDGIMIARGDLGIESSLARVPLLQKEFIARCLEAKKPVIVATQMLESMIRTPLPTRAEASDVANAVIDHTDAVMLSGESATGKYPVEAVKTMAEIVSQTEASHYDDLNCGPFSVTSRGEAVIQAACFLHQDIGAKAFAVITTSGDTARLVSRHRPELPIIAFTPDRSIQRQLILSWGVQSYLLKPDSWKSYLNQVNKILKKEKIVKKGDSIILVANYPFGRPKASRPKEPNLVEVHQVK